MGITNITNAWKYNHLYRQFNVKRVVQYKNVTVERKSEYFLLGATFDKVQFNDYEYDAMIYKDSLYVFI